MQQQVTSPAINDRRQGRAVASYSDARGALLAVDALRARGFTPDVAIQPGHMSLTPRVLRPTRSVPEWLAPSVAGLIAFASAVSWAGVRLGSVFVALALAVTAVGLTRMLDIGARRLSDRRLARAATTVRAGRFDVVVSEDDDEAEHLLASWSDPEARPAPIERRAA